MVFQSVLSNTTAASFDRAAWVSAVTSVTESRFLGAKSGVAVQILNTAEMAARRRLAGTTLQIAYAVQHISTLANAQKVYDGLAAQTNAGALSTAYAAASGSTLPVQIASKPVSAPQLESTGGSSLDVVGLAVGLTVACIVLVTSVLLWITYRKRCCVKPRYKRRTSEMQLVAKDGSRNSRPGAHSESELGNVSSSAGDSGIIGCSLSSQQQQQQQQLRLAVLDYPTDQDTDDSAKTNVGSGECALLCTPWEYLCKPKMTACVAYASRSQPPRT